MKSPFFALTLAAFALSISLSPAFADDGMENFPGWKPASAAAPIKKKKSASAPLDRNQDGRVGFRESMRGAWSSLEKAGAATKDKIENAVGKIREEAGDARSHMRLRSNYLTVVRNGDKVTLIHCNGRTRRLAHGSRCEKLHNGSFKINELKSCLASAKGDNRNPGMVLNRNLSQGAGISYDHFKMYDDKENYSAYLKRCERTLANKGKAAKPVAKAPVAPPAEVSEEFKPLEESAPADVKPPVAGDDKGVDPGLPPIGPIAPDTVERHSTL